MAAGRPVLATRAGGIVDAVVDGESGRLAPVGDVDAIADTMAQLQSSAVLRQRLAHGARERVKEFDVRVTVERTRAAYTEVLEDAAAS
jgi:glycosyltransferase involved in cell wall biosynthesis